MTNAERLHRWNAWYDGLPEQWRFQVVLWPLLLIGAINMLLTIAAGFPFGLLLVMALIGLIAIRVPYNVGWLTAATGAEGPGRTVSLGRVDWAYDLNLRYEALPEARRFWVVPVVLIVAGAINMALTLAAGFPFALLFLLALLALVAIRAPFAWGWFTPPGDAPAPDATRAALQGPSPHSVAFPWVGALPVPPGAHHGPTIEHEHVIPVITPISEPPPPANDPAHF